MKLFMISQNETRGYDTYSVAVVCADSEEEAASIHPDGDLYSDETSPYNSWKSGRSWARTPNSVKVEYIGEAAEHLSRGVICASFHAG